MANSDQVQTNGNGGGSSSFLHMAFQGNLGRDPEMRYTPSGTAVTNFSVAVNLPVRVNGENIVKALWVRVSAWGKLAEVCNEYLRKGRGVIVTVSNINFDPETGAPRIFTRQDGTAGTSLEVTASGIKFLSSRTDGEDLVEVAAEEPAQDLLFAS